MTKKTFNKLLSIILTVAICATTVFGCIMAANALDTPECVIEGSQCNTGDKNASATVLFTMPEGTGATAGTFTIDNTGDWYKEVTPSVEKADPGDVIDVFAEDGVVLFQIYDSDSSPKNYETITVNLDFVFKDGGITDTVKIKINDVELSGLYGDEYYTTVTDNSTNAYFTVGCQHQFTVSGDPASTSDKFGYSVYSDATCLLCGESKSDYQVVPQVKEDTRVVETWDGLDENGKWIGWTYSTFEGSGTEQDPYIVRYAEQLAHLTTAGASTYALTAGKYYKVDPSVKAFNMNTTGLDLSGDMTTAEVETMLAEEVVGRTYWTSAVFGGTFDGNGIEIYGLHAGNVNYGAAESGAQNAALFPNVAAGATIKNLTLKNSYLSTTVAHAGGIIANVTTAAADAGSTADTVYIENCVVHNCYIGSTNTDTAPGVIAGNVGSNAYININNVLIYGNEVLNSKNSNKSIVGVASKAANGTTLNRLTNSIVLDATPYDANGSWWFKACDHKIFQNVYFDQTASTSGFGNYGNANSKLTQLSSADDAKGIAAMTNMPDLDWNSDENPDGIWFTGYSGQYPTLFNKNAQSVTNGTNIDWRLLGTNIVYADDGSFALNFHYEPPYDSDVKLYVANVQNENKTKILSEHTASSFAGTILSDNARMFTLSGLSAKDLDILWLPTIITTSQAGNEIVYGETAQISIGAYAESVVLGNAFYNEDTTDAEKDADKNVAAALINYGLASKDALLSTQVENAKSVVDVWDGLDENGKWIGWTYSTFEGSGTEQDPYIVRYAEQLAHLTTAGASTYALTAGKYYKVDASVKAFNMNTTGLDLSGDMTTAEVETMLAEEVVGRTYWTSAVFGGTFDGNGIEIYGLHAGNVNYGAAESGAQNAALFPNVAAGATIKNLTLKNSYLSTTVAHAGGIIANVTTAAADAGSTADTVYIENCVVHNCYIGSTNTDTAPGVIAGNVGSNAYININNVLIYGNEVLNSKNSNKSIVGVASKTASGTTLNRLTNSIVLDATPYDANSSWWFKACDHKIFQNVYFDQTASTSGFGNYGNANSKLTQLSSADDAKGIAAMTNMPDLDWDTVWVYGAEGEYPQIALYEAKENTKGTISIRSQTDESQAFVLKDPSQPNSESNPYIVETAAQMYILMRGIAKDSAGNKISTTGTSNYFKVADGIDAFYMTSADLAALTNFKDVKAWFENSSNTDYKKVWSGTPFSGHFDGNGVEIYGIRSDDGLAALFPTVSGTTSVKNVTVKNSYLVGSSGAAGIVCKTTNGDNSTLTIENCAVINCYVEAKTNGAKAGAASLVGFSYGSPVIANDILIYGNDFVSPSGHSYGMVSYGSSSTSKFTNVISIGHEPYRVTDLTTGENGSEHFIKNDIFSGVYTDKVAQGAYYDASGDKTIHYFNYTDAQVKQLNTSQMQGPNAAANMPHLAWAENGGDWYVGCLGDYPGFEKAGILPSSVQSLYDAVVFDTADNYANSTADFGVYATSVNLNSNPYISFAFAFNGEYKENRDKITVKFTYTVDGAEQTFTTTPPAFTGDGTINGTDNWYNRPSAGRYHTYRFKDVPVEALANQIKVEVSYNGGEFVNLGSFSVEGLALELERSNRLNPCDYYTTRIEAVKALLFYTQMIQARYGA